MKLWLVLALLASVCADDTLLSRFRATLASRDSATLALEQWCAARGIASPAQITAAQQDDAAPATPAIRAALEVPADEPVRTRHVLLACGAVVLSDARNWYVPARLTPEMNRTLDTSRVPFGKVIAPLGLHRQPVLARMAPPAPCPAGTILHNSAILRRNDGQTVALVSECYTPANIAPR